jgi:DNA-binding HxlR family transcriptional regulator
MTKMTEEELMAALRSLERQGRIESRIVDGEVQWRITAKGRVVRRAIRDGDADWQEDSRYGLDS